MIRIIHFGKGLDERIHITDIMEADVYEFIPPGWHLISETRLEGKLPYSFPMDNTFSIVR